MDEQLPKGPNREERPRRSSRRSARRRRAMKYRADLPACPICQKPVRDLYSAITHRESGAPAHFDCVLQSLKGANDLSPSERICYLGAGTFGIIQNRGSQGPVRFVIRKRIQYESADSIPEWRRGLPRCLRPAPREDNETPG